MRLMKFFTLAVATAGLFTAAIFHETSQDGKGRIIAELRNEREERMAISSANVIASREVRANAWRNTFDCDPIPQALREDAAYRKYAQLMDFEYRQFCRSEILKLNPRRGFH